MSPIYKINFCILKKKSFIILKYKNSVSYFMLEFGIVFSKSFLNILFSGCSYRFSLAIRQWFKRFERPLRRKLLLVGLGLKVSFDKFTKLLQLKLEYSHLSFLKVPKNINIYIKKNVIFCESFDAVLLGNFICKLQDLKRPNPYKGKGIISYRNKQVLKPIKKTK